MGEAPRTLKYKSPEQLTETNRGARLPASLPWLGIKRGRSATADDAARVGWNESYRVVSMQRELEREPLARVQGKAPCMPAADRSDRGLRQAVIDGVDE